MQEFVMEPIPRKRKFRSTRAFIGMRKSGRRVVEVVIIMPINDRYSETHTIMFGVDGWTDRKLVKAAVKKMSVRIAGFNADEFVWDHVNLSTKQSEE